MRRIVVMSLLVSLTVVGGGIAIAGDGPRTDDVVAVFDLAPLSSEGIQCQGEDGLYFEFEDIFLGRIVSDDPRLDGEMMVRTRSLLNLDTGQSDIRGYFHIRDVRTDAPKVSGRVIGVGGPGGVAKGLVTGRVTSGGELIANFSVETDLETGEIHGEFGAQDPPVIADLAIIQSGSCRDKG